MTKERGALAKIAKAIASVHPAGCTDDEASAIVGAIAEAGYAVVPVEPTPGMAKIGVFVAETGTVLPAYEAMVRAFSLTTEGSDE